MVRDSKGKPVDGARVIVDGPGFPGPRCAFSSTNGV